MATWLLAQITYAQVPSYVPTNGLVGYWPFNGNANDASGNGNNGTVNGATLTTDRNGNANSAYSFNGTSNINISNSNIAAFLYSSFSCGAWFKTSSSSPGDIIRYDNCVTGSGWGLRIGYNNTGQIQGLEFDNSRNPNFVTSNNLYNNGNWHFVLYKRDISIMKDFLFIDNQLISETTFSSVFNIELTGHPLFIGAGCDFFNGDLDDIAIYNRALTQQEITALYTGTNAPTTSCLPTYVPTNGLVGYWPFCGNANDESGNGNNGIVYPNTTLTTDRNNIAASAYLFDNSTQSGIQTSNPLTYTLNGISGSVWFNSNVFLSSTSGHRMFISGTNNIPFQFAYNNGGVDLEVYDQNGSLTVYTWPAIFLANTWHHVVFSLNTNNSIIVSVDGQMHIVGTAPSSLRTATNSTFIFGLSSSAFWPTPFSGKLDDIAIYNRALTQQEITALYTGNSSTCVTPNALISSNGTNIPTGGLQLTANYDSSYSYQWLRNNVAISGANSNVYNASTTGSYSVIESIGNCVDTSNTITLTISNNSSCLPSYVPTNGLVGYWPFCGNANDESGNDKHGTVMGATLTIDRNGVSNSAYSFNGTSDYISIPDSFLISKIFTISFYAYSTGIGQRNILSDGSSSYSGSDFLLAFNGEQLRIRADKNAPLNYENNSPTNLQNLQLTNNWVYVTWVMDTLNSKIFLNGALQATINVVGSNVNFHNLRSIFGAREVWGNPDNFFQGKLDDIAMWNRVLSAQEIASLYTNSTAPCNPPIVNITAIGDTIFCDGSSVVLSANIDSTFTYQWKNNTTNILGATTHLFTAISTGSYTVLVSDSNGCVALSNTINVTVNNLPTVTLTSLPAYVNIQSANIALNGSPTGGTYTGAGVVGTNFSASTAGLGTSNVNYNFTNTSGCSGNASQSTVVYDTTGVVCTSTVTVYDTVTTYLSVTDTLIINQTLTGLVAPNNTNTIKIFPNPTNDHVTINYGNYALMNGYTLNITNVLGQVVFTSPINLASSYLDLSTWGGSGTYFVHIINAQGATVNTRKIVLQ